jgi:selenocysteine-specific elongation factor
LLHQVVRDLFYTDTVLRGLAAMLLQLAAENPVIEVAAFRDSVGLGRKRSVQILEYFDRIGLTRRLGDRRQIRLDSALAQANE